MCKSAPIALKYHLEGIWSIPSERRTPRYHCVEIVGSDTATCHPTHGGCEGIANCLTLVAWAETFNMTVQLSSNKRARSSALIQQRIASTQTSTLNQLTFIPSHDAIHRQNSRNPEVLFLMADNSRNPSSILDEHRGAFGHNSKPITPRTGTFLPRIQDSRLQRLHRHQKGQQLRT